MWDDTSCEVDLNPCNAYAGLSSFSLNFVHFPYNLNLNADYAGKCESDFLLMNPVEHHCNTHVNRCNNIYTLANGWRNLAFIIQTCIYSIRTIIR